MIMNELTNQTTFLLLQQAPATNSYAHLLLIGGIFIIMYFFMLRPQMNKVKKQEAFLNNLQKGDKVVTIGGIHGRITKVNEQTLLLEVSNNIRLKVEKSVISSEFTDLLDEPV